MIYAGCAVTAGPLVGLDVEASARHTTGDPLRLARRRFSPAEIASLESAAPWRAFVWATCMAYVLHCRRVLDAWHLAALKPPAWMPQGPLLHAKPHAGAGRRGGGRWLQSGNKEALLQDLTRGECVCATAGCEGAEERTRDFVRLWTLKEAYVKAVGRGISAPPGLNAFSLTLQPRCGMR